jgi:hypothetical protein
MNVDRLEPDSLSEERGASLPYSANDSSTSTAPTRGLQEAWAAHQKAVPAVNFAGQK